MAATIERLKFEVLDDQLKKERIRLAQESESLLGYRRLALATGNQGELLKALQRLDIKPFARDSVQKYQRQHARPGIWSGHRHGFIWLGVSAALLTASWRLAVMTDWNKPGAAALLYIALVIIGVLFCLRGFFLLTDRDARGSRILRRWEHVLLRDYTGSVPESVLCQALRVKKEVPEVQFRVEYLTESIESTVLPVRDPFLAATLAATNEFWYIDVWDEKEYNQLM